MIKKFALTEREMMVLALLIKGKTNKEIAEKLTISISTVKTYVEKIYLVFNVHNRVELVLYIFKNNISLPEGLL